MRKQVGNTIIDYELSDKEIAEMEEVQERYNKEYWSTVDYSDAVNDEIRKKYSDSQEFAILRQKDEKPDEYEEYFNYCEDCKNYVKSQIELYTK